MLQVMVQDDVDNQPKVAGYIVHDVCDKDGKIRFGSFEQNVLQPPLQFKDLDIDEVNRSPRGPEIISFSIMQPE